MLRVANPTYDRRHRDDSRVMIEADPLKNEHGQYDFYRRGPKDDDDAPPHAARLRRGVQPQLPVPLSVFQTRAGPTAVSEIETRAVADFAFDHPNIAAVFSFSPEDNLMHPVEAGRGRGPRATSHALKTATRRLRLSSPRNIAGPAWRLRHAPAFAARRRLFLRWAYLSIGRWSFAARGWWIPESGSAAGRSEDTGRKRRAAVRRIARCRTRERPELVGRRRISTASSPGRRSSIPTFRAEKSKSAGSSRSCCYIRRPRNSIRWRRSTPISCLELARLTPRSGVLKK